MSGSRENIQRLVRYIQQNPEDTFSKFALALELLKNNQYKKALTLFESIYHNNPDYLGVYYHLGKLYQSMDRYEEAKKCYREGISLARSKQDKQTHKELNEALEEIDEEKKDDQ